MAIEELLSFIDHSNILLHDLKCHWLNKDINESRATRFYPIENFIFRWCNVLEKINRNGIITALNMIKVWL